MNSRRLLILASLIAGVLGVVTWRSKVQAERQAELWAAATDPVL